MLDLLKTFQEVYRVLAWFHSEVGFVVPCLIMSIFSSCCSEKRVSWVFKFACLFS